MKDKKGPDLTLQVKEAKQLMDLGHVREALVLVMDALWRELDQLRDTLRAVQESLPTKKNETPAGDGQEESCQSEFVWPDPPSRLLH